MLALIFPQKTVVTLPMSAEKLIMSDFQDFEAFVAHGCASRSCWLQMRHIPVRDRRMKERSAVHRDVHSYSYTGNMYKLKFLS